MSKIVLITSDDLRHRFFASKLAEKLNIVGIVTEKKAPAVTDFSGFSSSEQKIISQHFAQRSESEIKILGEANFPDTNRLNLVHGQTNSHESFEWIERLNPNAIVLYGSSIIKDPILSGFENKIINIHLGLSPYYRGSGTNFWPLVNGEPECVGGTIHLAVLKVDAGNILKQFRPEVEFNDGAHDLGTKVIVKGAELMPTLVKSYLANDIIPQTQDLTIGKVFKTKDFNSEAVTAMWTNLGNGMMLDYIVEKSERDTAHPIVD